MGAARPRPECRDLDPFLIAALHSAAKLVELNQKQRKSNLDDHSVLHLHPDLGVASKPLRVLLAQRLTVIPIGLVLSADSRTAAVADWSSNSPSELTVGSE